MHGRAAGGGGSTGGGGGRQSIYVSNTEGLSLGEMMRRRKNEPATSTRPAAAPASSGENTFPIDGL